MLKKQNNKTRRISPSTAAVYGSLAILLGGFFLFYNYIQTMKIASYDNMANLLIQEVKFEEPVVDEKEEETGSNEEPISDTREFYLGYLEIPKIGFKKGFFPMGSSENDVEKNIFIVDGSSYPDVENGNFIVAGHSGTGWKAFFNDLYKLTKEDEVLVEYNGKTYHYSIIKIYKQEKTGTIAIYRHYDKTTLTLVTCTNNDSKTQTIYIAELTRVE